MRETTDPWVVAGSDRVPLAHALLTAVLVVAVAQVARMLFPITFEIGEDWDFPLAGLFALETFSTALFAVLALRLRPRQQSSLVRPLSGPRCW